MRKAKSSVPVLLAAFVYVWGVFISASGEVLAASSGEELYEWYCTQCHGLRGMGDGINSGKLPVSPKDHTDKSDPKKYMRNLSDEEIFSTIKNGGAARKKSNLMPVWGGVLSDDEINSLVKHLPKLCCE